MRRPFKTQRVRWHAVWYKKTPFFVSDATTNLYFKTTVNERNMNNDFLEDERRNHTPQLLKQHVKKDVFQVPEGYFDALEDRVLARINTVEVPRQPLVKISNYHSGRIASRRWMMAAAAVLGLICCAIWFIRQVVSAQQLPVGTELAVDVFPKKLPINQPETGVEQLVLLELDHTKTVPTQSFQATPNHDLSLEDLSPDQVDQILFDMSEDEIREIL